jgi:hypothetical protein
MTIRRRRALPARRVAHGQPRRQAGQHAVVAIPYCPAGPSTQPQLHRDDRDATEGNQPQRARAPDPPIGTDVGLAPIKTKAVQIWESCAHEVHAGRSRSGRNRR